MRRASGRWIRSWSRDGPRRQAAQAEVQAQAASAGIEAAKDGGFHSIGLGPRERVGNAEGVFLSLSEVRLADLLKALGTTHTSRDDGEEK